MTTVEIEVCVETPDGARQAQAAGAHRIELCASLVEGGITPSLATVETTVAAVSVPVMVLVRPRAGDFIYSAAEVGLTVRDIEVVREAGARGVVIGCLDDEGRVNRDACRRLIDAAFPLHVTFHRAFDLARDPLEALDVVTELGFESVLTSGRAASAWEGRELIRALVERTRGRPRIIAGGKVRPDNVRQLVEVTGITQVHLSASTIEASPLGYVPSDPGLGSGRVLKDSERRITSSTLIQELRDRLHGDP